MPIKTAVWRIDNGVKQINPSILASEDRLHKILEQDITLLSSDLFLIGSKIRTGFNKEIDLLAVDLDGNLNVIELKKDKTPREVVAQILDYASWAKTLSYDEIVTIYEDYTTKKQGLPGSFEKDFAEALNTNPPDALNESHRMTIVASELDLSSERIVNYLSQDFGVPINVVFFRYFTDVDREFLTRTWLIDPLLEKQEPKASKQSKESWNEQDFYLAIGEGIHRSWSDCVKFGFASAGQGRWYSRSLEALYIGARVFACVPGKGYVGVGIVTDVSQPIKNITVDKMGTTVPLLEAGVIAPNMNENADNLDLCEYVVKVNWLKTVPVSQACWEKGMFANQNTACRLRNKFTLTKLYDFFGLESI